jgi:hypothetical protein
MRSATKRPGDRAPGLRRMVGLGCAVRSAATLARCKPRSPGPGPRNRRRRRAIRDWTAHLMARPSRSPPSAGPSVVDQVVAPPSVGNADYLRRAAEPMDPLPAHRGNSRTAAVPPSGSGRRSTAPPCNIMTRCTKARPRPTPRVFVEKNGSNRWARAAGESPRP